MQGGRGRGDAGRGPRVALISVAAVIVAAGRGERFGPGDGSLKQFRPLGGKPLIQWSLETFKAGGCDALVVVVPQDSIDQARELSAGWDPITVTAGGDTRQNSVSSGLEEISSDLVLIHDAARPFATRELIGRVVAELVEYDGAIPALPLDETVKRVHDERVAETIDRERLWAVQTPQGFRTDVLRRAHEKAREEGIEGTDDATLVERYGGTIKVVRGLRSNLKITYPEDFEIAEALAHGVER